MAEDVHPTLSLQLTYNVRNLAGDGCMERKAAGLSALGVALIERLKELKMVVTSSR